MRSTTDVNGREKGMWGHPALFILLLSATLPLGGCSPSGEEVEASQRDSRIALAGGDPRTEEAFFQGGAASALDLNGIGYDQGSPDAPIKVIEITDFGCGYCRQFNQQTYPVLLEEFVETGRIQWKFVPFVLGMFPNGDKAALASECAGAQSEDAFLRMRDQLFSSQARWRSSQEPDDLFTDLAVEEGLDGAAFSRCLRDGERTEEVDRNVRLGKALGVRGTPLFIIGGIPVPGSLPVERFRLILESILAAGDAFEKEWLPHPPTPTGPSITELVHTAGLGYSMGSPDAPLDVVEFSDFGCGYCRLFQEETRPILLDEYVDSGLVRWTYVPFVLGIFPNGEEAAMAGECAGSQGEFEPMRRRLYRDQAGWRDAEDPASFFTRIASEEGLDADRFASCLTDQTAAARVWENTRLGRMGGVQGAPAFLVDGFLVSGAKPLESFRDLLDLKLSSAGQGG